MATRETGEGRGPERRDPPSRLTRAKDARGVYRERTWAPPWVWALLSVVFMASVGGAR